MPHENKATMTASQRALRLERLAPGKFAILLWTSEDDDALVRVVRLGRIIPLNLGTSDFNRRPLNAVRWAARHYKVDTVYVISSRHESDADAHCRRYTRRDAKPANVQRGAKATEPKNQRPM